VLPSSRVARGSTRSDDKIKAKCTQVEHVLTNVTQNQQEIVRPRETEASGDTKCRQQKRREHKTCIDTKRWELKYTRSSSKVALVETCNYGGGDETRSGAPMMTPNLSYRA
jgi:hypothetical protein